MNLSLEMKGVAIAVCMAVDMVLRKWKMMEKVEIK